MLQIFQSTIQECTNLRGSFCATTIGLTRYFVLVYTNDNPGVCGRACRGAQGLHDHDREV